MQRTDRFVIRAEEADAASGKQALETLLPAPRDAADLWQGAAILAQFQCAAGFLVLYDQPGSFENGPGWVLLNPTGAPLDEGGKALMYTETDTTGIAPIGEDAIGFTAHGHPWQLRVLATPQWRWSSLFNEALFLPTLRKRWLVLSRGA